MYSNRDQFYGQSFVHLDDSSFEQEDLGFVHVIKNHDPDDEIKNLERLVRIHFLLRTDTVDFIVKLPKRLQRMRIDTKKVLFAVNGQVQGKINWPRTIHLRSLSNPLDETHFVIERIVKNYDIPENLILKNLLSILYSIIVKDLIPAMRKKHPDPNLQKLVSHKKLNKLIIKSFIENVHVRRIIPIENIWITKKMVKVGMKSRHRLYRDATMLYRSYKNLFIDIHEYYEEAVPTEHVHAEAIVPPVVFQPVVPPAVEHVMLPGDYGGIPREEPEISPEENVEEDEVVEKDLDEVPEEIEMAISDADRDEVPKEIEKEIPDEDWDEVPEDVEEAFARDEEEEEVIHAVEAGVGGEAEGEVGKELHREVGKDIDKVGKINGEEIPGRKGVVEQPPGIKVTKPRESRIAKLKHELETIRSTLDEGWWDYKDQISDEEGEVGKKNKKKE